MRSQAVRPFATLLVLATMACGDCDEWMPTSVTPMAPDSSQTVVAEAITDSSGLFNEVRPEASITRGAP